MNYEVSARLAVLERMLEATHGRLRAFLVRELEAEVVRLITPYFRKCLSWSSESRRESGQLLVSPSDDDSRGVESGIVQDLARELREFARTLLAPFKVPTRIAVVAALPRGSFDKVKRGEVARLAEAVLRTDFVAPRDREETEAVRAFGEALGLDRIGAQDNFFQLGGDSLRAVRVAERLQSVFGKPIGLDALFQHPTARALAEAIRADVLRPDHSSAPAITPLPRPSRKAGGRARRKLKGTGL